MLFTKYTLFTEQNIFIWKKKLFKKTFTEKNINKHVKKMYILFQKYIFTKKMFVLKRKYKYFLNIYSFCKKKF